MDWLPFSQTWWQVPPVARVILEGQLPVGVTGKDVIITLCGHFNQDEVRYEWITIVCSVTARMTAGRVPWP